MEACIISDRNLRGAHNPVKAITAPLSIISDRNLRGAHNKLVKHVLKAGIISDRNLRGAHNQEWRLKTDIGLYQTETCAVLTTSSI